MVDKLRFLNYDKKKGKAFCDSLKIAEVFGKRHKYVLKKIRLEISRCDDDDDFIDKNFQIVEYVDKKGRKKPKYILTRDGFSVVPIAHKTKKDYSSICMFLQAFSKMEEHIESIQSIKNELLGFIEYVSELEDKDEFTEIIFNVTNKLLNNQINLTGD